MDPLIAAAFITGVCTGVPSFVAAVAAWRRAHRSDMNTRSNGHGTLSEMSELQLVMLGELQGQLQAHTENPDAHIPRLTNVRSLNQHH